MSETIHVFERAGLGKAPFRFVGIERRVGPFPVPGHPGCFVGGPGQPVGTCEFCGEGIAECCIIEGADGKRFVVGNVCVAKTSDAGLRKMVDRAVRERRRVATRERQVAQVAEALALLEREDVRALLGAMPHPWPDRAVRGETCWGWADWWLHHAGPSSASRVARWVRDWWAKQQDAA